MPLDDYGNLIKEPPITEKLADYFTQGPGVGREETSGDLADRFGIGNRGTITKALRTLSDWGFIVKPTREGTAVYYRVEWPRAETRHWRTVRAATIKAVDSHP